MTLLEASVREHLEVVSPRVMAVLNPIKVVLTNFLDGVSLSREALFHPQQPALGSRVCALTKEIYIEADDFQEFPEAGFQRLRIDGEVRLRHSYVIKCNEVIKDEGGKIIQLNCSIDHNTLGKNPEGRKVKGVIHWVSKELSFEAEVRLYDRLFTEVAPDKVEGQDFTQFLNKNSLQIVTGYIEPSGKVFLSGVERVLGDTISNNGELRALQFERLGYFIPDTTDNKLTGKIIFNKTIGLKDTWRK